MILLESKYFTASLEALIVDIAKMTDQQIIEYMRSRRANRRESEKIEIREVIFMKKIFVLFLVVAMMCSILLVGCDKKTDDVDMPQNNTVQDDVSTNDVSTNDGPPPKENRPTATQGDVQYVKDGKFYLGELFIFSFTSTTNGESRPGWGHKVSIDVISEELEPYKIADVHNDKIEQCILGIVELQIASPEDFFHLKNGDTVVWETTINQAKLDEFNSYIEGVEIIVDPTYTVTVQGLEEN